MKRILIALAVLALGMLACGQYVTLTPTPNALVMVPTATIPAATRTATVPTATVDTPNAETATIVQAVVTIRDAPNGEPTGDYLKAGETVTVLRCVGDWCRIKEPLGWVYRGCLSDNPDELGCTAK
jgi:SH3-like domain-containing protein